MNLNLSFHRLISLWILPGLILVSIGIFACQKSPQSGSFQNDPDINILNDWHFQVDIFDIGEKEQWFTSDFENSGWRKVKIPGAWDAYDEALWGYEGVGWYATRIPMQMIQKNKRIILKFNRVNYYSKVWINGILIGENIGGYLPFEWDVSKYLKTDEDNLLVLRVDNKPRIDWLPASKQIEWVQYGGILQPVELRTSNSIYISDLTIQADSHGNEARVICMLKIANDLDESRRIKVLVRIPTDAEPLEKTVVINCNSNSLNSVRIPMFIPEARLWSPASPQLYRLFVSISDNGKVFDHQEHRFGVRSVQVKGNRILLNGVPFKIKGVNRYDIFDRQGPILDEQKIREDLFRIKQTGANTIRVHYPQSPLTLNLLDEVGLLLIEELPLNWWGQNWWDKEEIRQDTGILKQARMTLQKMIQRDKNHPCIFAWSLANECKTETKTGAYVLKELIVEAHRLDSTRLTTFTVNSETNMHPAFEIADFVSCNVYFGNDNAYHETMLDSLVRLPSEKYIRRQCNYYVDKPLLVSEFGASGIYGISGDVLFSEDFQAKYIKKVWEAIENVPQCSGGVLWCWADYYHRKYFTQTYAPFGPYGILNVERKPKKAFKMTCQIFGGK